MKKRLLIEALWNNRWAGGMYYARNIIYSLSLNEYITGNFEIIVHTFKENESVFKDLKVDRIIYSTNKGEVLNLISGRIARWRTRSDFSYPWTLKKTFYTKKTDIAWVPDLQHKYYPEFFTDKELNEREIIYNSFIREGCPIVFSSNTCSEDFKRFYPGSSNVYIVPFVSYIEPLIRSLTQEEEKSTLEKYNLHTNTYACVMNQFWQHKNHKVVFEAMEKIFKDNPDLDLKFVFTGKMEDKRNPKYIENLKQILQSETIRKHTVFPGFIDRKEQIAIMKNASFVIQPSMFEGWGTVVEDAKVLDKTILLSDIPVHHEQMNEKCILFGVNDSDYLKELILTEIKKEHHESPQKGMEDMRQRAIVYSKQFEKMLRELETK